MSAPPTELFAICYALGLYQVRESEQQARDAVAIYNAHESWPHRPYSVARYVLAVSQPWRDIATAPKDGTLVLLWCDAWPFPRTGWTFNNDPWQDCDAGRGPPTHWMPLPQPPALAIETGTAIANPDGCEAARSAPTSSPTGE
jgi:hypothetical protein